MDKVPEIISTKDLSYIEDMFNWHFISSKKAYNYSNIVTDEDVKYKLLKIASSEAEICEKLIKILN